MLAIFSVLGFATENAEVQAGVLSFLGVLLTGLAAIVTWLLNRKKERDDQAARLEDRKQDLRLAVWSDILPIWTGLFRLGSPDDKLSNVEGAFARARTENDKTYTPFAVPAAEPLFSAQLVEDVALLEFGEIEPIVRFYHQLSRLNQMAKTMRDPTFAGLSLDRKEKALINLTKLEIQTEEEACKALIALEKTMLGRTTSQVSMEMRIRRETVLREEAKRAA
ncbi:MAG: hypothetical protein KDE08_16520 [Rhodobacteraceae bacterium]|nr:hypothetical protein [Paracoccaceae bacterium]